MTTMRHRRRLSPAVAMFPPIYMHWRAYNVWIKRKRWHRHYNMRHRINRAY